MKTIATAIAASLFAVSVSASDIYHGFAGNPDLYDGYVSSMDDISATRPGIGDSFDRYHGLSDGNPDLFGDVNSGVLRRSSGPANVYHGFEIGNPDLQ